MAIRNVFASVPVRDLSRAVAWYTRLLGRAPDHRPTAKLAEWALPGGGGLQVYEGPERAGRGSFTMAVDDFDREVDRLRPLVHDAGEPSRGAAIDTWMFADPDGNRIALARAHGEGMLR